MPRLTLDTFGKCQVSRVDPESESAHLTFTHLELAKTVEEGANLVQFGFREKSTILRKVQLGLRKRGFDRIANRLGNYGSRVSQKPIRMGINSLGRGVLIAESLISIGCTIKCTYDDIMR